MRIKLPFGYVVELGKHKDSAVIMPDDQVRLVIVLDQDDKVLARNVMSSWHDDFIERVQRFETVLIDGRECKVMDYSLPRDEQGNVTHLEVKVYDQTNARTEATERQGSRLAAQKAGARPKARRFSSWGDYRKKRTG